MCNKKTGPLFFDIIKVLCIKRKKSVSKIFVEAETYFRGPKMISRKEFREIYRSFEKSFWTHGNRYLHNRVS